MYCLGNSDKYGLIIRVSVVTAEIHQQFPPSPIADDSPYTTLEFPRCVVINSRNPGKDKRR